MLVTKLDYIFLSTSLAANKIQTTTKAGNSDHLLLEVSIKPNTTQQTHLFWKLNSSVLQQDCIPEQAADILICTPDWDTAKNKLKGFLQHHTRTANNKKRCQINKIQKQIDLYSSLLTKYPTVEHYKSLLAGLKTEQKKHISTSVQKLANSF